MILFIIKLRLKSKNTFLLFLLYFRLLEPILFCLYLMDQRFHHSKNKSIKFTLLKNAYFTYACLLN
jgi:hypothetical protein